MRKLFTILLFFSVIFYTGCADAGKDQKVKPGVEVKLDGSNSKPGYSNVKIVGYQWEQISGVPVKLNNANTKLATFIAPNVSKGNKELKFKLTTKEEAFGRYKFNNSDTTVVTIESNVVDKTPPIIRLNGLPQVTINVGDKYQDAGAMAVDNIDGVITDKIIVKNSVNTQKAGEYRVTYNVKDSAGNSAKEVYRVVIVKPINKKVFIIGDSMVHQDSINVNKSEGWGDELAKYAIKPENIINLARASASAAEYKEPNDNGRYWDVVEDKMAQDKEEKILLIQFGGPNDTRYYNLLYPITDKNGTKIDYNEDGIYNSDDTKVREEIIKQAFMDEVGFYIDRAKELNAIPILITPPNSKSATNTRENYPTYIKELAKAKKVQYLDLHQYSLDEFKKYTNEQLIGLFGLYKADGTIDNINYNSQGATIVAGWVRNLACGYTSPNNATILNYKKTPLCQELNEKKAYVFAYGGQDRDKNNSISIDSSTQLYGVAISTLPSYSEDYKYEWSENGKVLSNSKILVYKNSELGEHTLKLKATDKAGNSGIDEIKIDITDLIYDNRASVGDFVWLDSNANGIQDENEKGVEGVVVEIFSLDKEIIKKTKTNKQGEYLFKNLPPKTYQIRVTLPKDYSQFTIPYQGDEKRDSDIVTYTPLDYDHRYGFTKEFTLESNQQNNTIDIGMLCPKCLQ